jgi:Uncharacterized protein conserved in bacteria
MKTIQTMIISGYRSFELGIFQEKDPKIKVIKKVIKMSIQQQLEEGLEWILIGGNLGVELWAGEVCLELQKEYPELKLGVLFPFENFGDQWNEKNKQLLTDIKIRANYVNATSHAPYQNPSQLKNHTRFLLEHSGGAILIYDEEYPGKTDYLLKDIRRFSEQTPYFIQQITMDDLQNIAFDGDSV